MFPGKCQTFIFFFNLILFFLIILKSLILTCVPKHEPPSHLPPHNISLGHPFLCSCRRIIFDDPLSWWLSTSNSQPLLSSSSRLSSPLQIFLNHYFIVHLLAVPGPNALLMLQVVSTALRPILNLNTKTAQICFLSNSISIV